MTESKVRDREKWRKDEIIRRGRGEMEDEQKDRKKDKKTD